MYAHRRTHDLLLLVKIQPSDEKVPQAFAPFAIANSIIKENFVLRIYALSTNDFMDHTAPTCVTRVPCLYSWVNI